MARIRSIKPEFWVSEQVAECSPNARLTFVGMWTFSDDQGVHPAKPKTLKAELFPMDDVSSGEVEAWVGELIAAGLVARYTGGDGQYYWHITGWNKHQKIDKPSAKYPAPPAPNSESVPRVLAEPSQNPSRAPSPGEESKGEESKGEESKGEGSSSRAGAQPGSLSSKGRGSRLPADWVLPEAWRVICRTERPDLNPDAVAKVFRDYWCAKSGKGATKLDWQATWSNWVRNEKSGTYTAAARRPALDTDDVFVGAV